VKAQVSVETVMVVGLSFLLIIPATFMLYEFLLNGADDIKNTHITQIGQSFQDNANLIYRLGDKAKIIVQYSFPDSITNMSVDNSNILVITADTGTGPQAYIFEFGHNVSANFIKEDWQKGNKDFEFRAINRGEEVSIKRV